MNKKAIGIIIIVLAGLILIGIVYVIFFHKFSSQQETATENQTATSTQNINKQLILVPLKNAEIKIPSKKNTEINQDDLVKIASSFVERFGSFSNQSDYSNISDLKLFMSSKMQDWADKYVQQAQAKNRQTVIYYGVTTKTVVAEVKQFDNESGKAEILIKSQRREATGVTANSSVFYQDMTIKFVKEKGAWKINSAVWQAK